ncbi:MAG: glycosyltransferase family protein [Solirubrobacteraceae bacterium]
MSPDAPRVLFYSHNGVGVGHFRRQLKLAAALQSRIPEAVVLLVTGSHSVQALNGPFGFDCVSLPSIRMVDRYENWEPRRLDVSRREVMRMRSDLLRRTVRRFRPDLLVADFMPAGPYGELVPALDELAAAGGRAVAGFRDIIDEESFVRELWRRTGVLDVLREHYHAIWVYGTPGVVDYVTGYGLEGALAERVRYLGYLAPTGDGGDRRPRWPAVQPVITASTGGGVDGAAVLATFIAAITLIDPATRGHPVVVGGPLLGEGEMASLHESAARAQVEVTRFLPGLDRRIAGSDLVVTMPGYNTTCEILAGHARAIVVPRSGPSQEQRLRAERLVEWGRATTLEPDGLTPGELSAAIKNALERAAPPPALVPLDGLARAGEQFAELLSGQPVRGAS